jgi:LytS/YehU family sensor histidine kinase
LSHSGLYALLCYASPPLFHALFVRFHPNLLTYWAIVGFTQALDYFDRYKDRERKLAQAELLLTKSQLQPHFLFNTLHTIAAMMREDVAAAERMIVQLGDLLRVLLEHVGAHEVPLATELDFVTGYTEIQKMRHVGRLDLDVHVDPELLDALVPNMLLQPLVENAIRHGLSNARNDMLTITISAHRMGADVALSVADNGRGPAREVRDGIGLATTRARLRELYGERACVELHARQPAGCAATVILPHHIHTSVELRRGGPVCPAGADEISSGVYGDTNGDRGRRALGEKALTHPA